MWITDPETTGLYRNTRNASIGYLGVWIVDPETTELYRLVQRPISGYLGVWIMDPETTELYRQQSPRRGGWSTRAFQWLANHWYFPSGRIRCRGCF